MRTKAVETTMPMLAVRGLVMFPKVVLHFDVSRKKSETALKAAKDYADSLSENYDAASTAKTLVEALENGH